MIPTKTRYKIYDGEFLAIVKAFKTWRHYLESCKHKVFLLTNHNNLRRFINTKSLSLKQVRWVQKPLKHHFRIDYCQSKANGAADALFCFLQRNKNKEEKLWAENTQIFHWLQSSLTNASLSGLNVTSSILLPCHQILICETHALSQLC